MKDIQRSLRMSQATYDYVMAWDGSGFNQNFERLVRFCMEEEANIKESIHRLQREKDALADEIALYKKIRRNLAEIDSHVRSLTERVDTCVILPGQQAM